MHQRTKVKQSSMAIKFEDWQDIKVAFEVARFGTLTAAAEELNVHHSTVLRRINNLEKNLNTRLFHRHARGYKVTEIGTKLFLTAQTIHSSLEQLHNDIASADSTLRGSLLLTTVSGFIDVLGDVCEQFQVLHPQVQLEVILEQKRLRLDHGQAHIALRVGPKPDEGDYVAQHLVELSSGLYANKRYIAKYGLPNTLNELQKHSFVSGVAGYNAQVPYFSWVDENISPSQVKLRVSETSEATRAIIKGLGIGGLQHDVAAQYDNLVPILHNELSWPFDVWLVTHHLVHRTAKVQAFAGLLKSHFKKASVIYNNNFRG